MALLILKNHKSIVLYYPKSFRKSPILSGGLRRVSKASVFIGPSLNPSSRIIFPKNLISLLKKTYFLAFSLTQ